MNTPIQKTRLLTFISMKALFIPFIIILMFVFAMDMNAQTTIYSEDFNSYPDFTTSSSLWSITTTGGQNYFDVRNSHFEGSGPFNWNGEMVWISSVIDIACYTNVQASMDVGENGSQEGDEYVNVYYILDGGDEIAFANNGTNFGNFSPTTASQTGLNGSTLQIVVRTFDNSSSESHEFDNIVVTGTAVTEKIINASASICAGDSIFLAGVYRTTAGNYADTTFGIGCNTILITTLSLTNCCGALTLYDEDFTYPDGTASSPDWALSGSPAGYFEVRSNVLVGNDLDEWVKWTSRPIGITGLSNVSISILGEGYGDIESNEGLDLGYILDGGSEVIFASYRDDFSPVTSTQTGLSGNTLQLVAYMNNSFNQEFVAMDNVLVTATGYPFPTCDITGTEVICSGDTSIFSATAGMAAYSWSGPGGFTGNAESVNVTEDGTYNVTISTSHACTATCDRALTVNPLPLCNITGTDTICDYETTSFTASGGTSYTWSGPNAFSSDSATISGINEAGEYSVTVTDANGCTSTCSRTLVLNPTPICSITGTNVMCTYDTTEFTASGGISYVWSGPNGFSANTAATGTLTGTDGGVYSVTVTDDNGCTITCSDTLTVNPIPVCDIEGSVQACPGNPTRFTALGGVSYVWSGPNSFSATTDTTGPIFDGGEYSVTVTDENGCTSTCSKIFELGAPQSTFSGDSVICTDETTELIVSEALSYNWEGPNAFTTNSQSTGIITGSDLTAGIYTVIATFPGGCQDTSSVNLVVNPLPICDITGNDTICDYEFTEFTATGGTSYQWSGPGGFTHSGDTTGNINVAGTYTVTVTDSNGCSSSCSRTLVVNPAPVCVISGDSALCPGETTQFTASGGLTYVWSGPNGFSATTDTTRILTYLDSSSIPYSVTMTLATGCSSTCSAALVSNSSPICNIIGIDTICSDGTTTFTASGGASYAWTGPAGFAPTSDNPIVISIAGTYEVTVTSADGCQSTCSRTLTVNQVPVCTIEGDTALCLGETTSLTASGGASYLWTASESAKDCNGVCGGTAFLDSCGICSGGNTGIVPNSSIDSCGICGGDGSDCAPPPTPCVQLEIVSFTLWTGGLGAEIGPIANGSVINLAVTPSISVVADYCSTPVGSVSFFLNGSLFRTEGTQPYVLTGDNDPWNASPGTYTITATPYSGGGGSGTEGISKTITVTVINDNTLDCDNVIAGSAYINSCGICVGGTTGLDEDEGKDCLGVCGGSATLNNCGFCTSDSTDFEAESFTANTDTTGSISDPGIYTVVVTDTNGCQSTCSKTLDVFPLPTCDISGGVTQICSGTSTQWTASGGGVGATYAWAPAFGLSATNIANPIVSPTATGITNFTYSVTVTTANGCTTTPCERTITVDPAPFCLIRDFPINAADPITSFDTICTGQSTQWNVSGGVSYSWSGPNNFSSNNSTITINNAGTYNVTVTGLNGCLSTCSRTLVVVSRPVAASITGGVTTICFGDTTTWYAPTGGVGGTYNWAGPAGSFTFDPASPAVHITATSTGTYSVTVSNVSGCSNTGAINRGLFVNPLPACTLNDSIAICADESTILTASTNTGGQIYFWAGPDSFSSTSRIPTVNAAGIYTVTVTTTSTGCTNTCSQEVTHNPVPDGVISGLDTICPAQVAQFTASGGVGYTWSGTAPFNQVNPTVINVGNSGIYTVTVTNEFGCTDIVNKSLYVNPSPVITVSGTNPICASDSFSIFTASGGTYYYWVGPAGFVATTENPIIATIPGVYLVTGYDDQFCEDQSGKVLIINPNPVCNVTGPSEICYGDTAIIAAAGGTSYSWTGPGGFSSTANPIKATVTGTYEVVITKNGCSNTSACSHELTVNPLPVCSIAGDSVICANETTTLTAHGGVSYSWSGPAGFDSTTANPITAFIAGTYTVTVTDSNGCVSSCSQELYVNALPICSIVGDTLVCEGDTATFTAFGGIIYSWTGPNGFTPSTENPLTTTLAGNYPVLVTDTNGCSTTCCEIELALKPVPHTTLGVEICDGDCYTAGGNCQTTTGTYYDTLAAANGCDSIVITHLLINPVYVTPNNVTICEFTCHVAGGACQTEAGTYYDTLQSVAGCDSVIVTQLSISDVYFINVTRAICEGESFYVGGGDQTQAGMYYDTLQATNGCDSIVATDLSIKTHSFSSVDVSICNNECHLAGGDCQNTAGIYYDTLISANGCDSIVTTNLTIRSRSFTPLAVTICDNDCYTAGGGCQNVSGIYYDTLVAANGCDSIVTTNLTVNPTFVTSNPVAICAGTCHVAGGTCQYDPGTYYDTLQSAQGCDSIIVTDLTLKGNYLIKIGVDICEGDSFFVGGGYQTTTGDYWDTLVATNGCDSLVITDLDVLSPSYGLVEISICDNECYTAGGACQNVAGFYYDTLVATNGCDSLLTTSLEILQRSFSAVPISICEGDCYSAGGGCQSISGTYHDTLTAANGCDSIVATVLTVIPSYHDIFYTSICSGECHTAGGNCQTTSGTYYDTLTAIGNGCDSIVATVLTVHPSYIVTNPVTICGVACYNAGGACQNTAGTYYDTLPTINGCDSIVITELVIRDEYTTNISELICDGESFFVGGKNQTTSGTYYDTLTAINGCDSVIVTILTVHPHSSGTVNVSICFGECHTAGGSCQTTSGTYYDTLSAASGCDSIITTELLVQNSCDDNEPCTIDACNGGTCTNTWITNCGDCALRVDGFTLIDAATDQPIGPLNDGDIINLAFTPDIAIRADLCTSPVGSVRFGLNAANNYRTESAVPYALEGDNNGDYNNWNATVGLYTLTATPYSGAGGGGTEGTALTISFTVIDQLVVNDCNGDNGGTAFLDDCNVCSGGNSGHIANSDKDDCNVCFGGNADKDCNDECFGSAFIDGCGTCVGGNTGLSPCPVDCNGDPGGSALLDDCNICSEGNSGHTANSDKDDCDVCFGGNIDKDCNDECFGSAFVDGCGTCVGGNTGLTPCPLDCNGDPAGTAFLDDCNVCSGGNSGHTANSDKDDCDICFGGNADQDCNGECFGSAFIDDCSVCAGGTTGITPNDCGCDLRVTSFTLINSSSDNDIGPLNNGGVINLAITPNISIRANVCNPVGSVRFGLNTTSNYKTESIAPYAIAGDNNGDYNKWNVSVGTYTLTGTAFANSGGSGASGVPYTINFTVINQIAPECTNPGDCDDGLPCTVDACVGGSCTHTLVNVNDNNACTVDQCNPATGAITHTPVNTDDGNACTIDACNPVTGISHTPIAGCCTTNGDCDDGDPCTIDYCDGGICIHDAGGGSEPSYIKAVNPSMSWRKLKLGYNPTSIWVGPAQNVIAGGNNTLCITLREVIGTVNWNKIQIRPQGNDAVVIGNYLPVGGIGNSWTQVCIPLSAFATSNFASLMRIQIPYSNGAGAFEIHIQKIEFTGGTSPFLWFGDPKTDNAHDGQSGQTGAIIAEVVAGDPCSGGAKLSGGDSDKNNDQPMFLRAYPNPFKDKVTIEFSLSKSEKVLVEIRSLEGKLVDILFNGNVEQDELHHVEFRSGSMPSGMYFYRVITESGEIENRKLMLMN